MKNAGIHCAKCSKNNFKKIGNQGILIMKKNMYKSII